MRLSASHLLTALTAAFGVTFSLLPFYSLTWQFLTVLVFSIPLGLQLCPFKYSRECALLLAGFLLLQTAVTPLLLNKQYKHLPPKIRISINVVQGIPGISGLQTITTDHMGYRVTKAINYAHKQGWRVFAIGASTTEEIYLDDYKTWTHLLQEKLEQARGGPVEVINTGAAGLRLAHHITTLKHILPYKPDLILFLFGINDWNREIQKRLDARRPHRTLLDMLSAVDLDFGFKRTPLGQAMYIAWNRAAAALWRTEHSAVRVEEGAQYSIGKRNSLARPERYELVLDNVPEEYAKQVQEIGDICQQSAIQCMFINPPTGDQKGSNKEF